MKFMSSIITALVIAICVPVASWAAEPTPPPPMFGMDQLSACSSGVCPAPMATTTQRSGLFGMLTADRVVTRTRTRQVIPKLRTRVIPQRAQVCDPAPMSVSWERSTIQVPVQRTVTVMETREVMTPVCSTPMASQTCGQVAAPMCDQMTSQVCGQVSASNMCGLDMMSMDACGVGVTRSTGPIRGLFKRVFNRSARTTASGCW